MEDVRKVLCDFQWEFYYTWKMLGIVKFVLNNSHYALTSRRRVRFFQVAVETISNIQTVASLGKEEQFYQRYVDSIKAPYKYVCVYVCMYVCTYGRTVGRRYVCTYVWTHWWTDGWRMHVCVCVCVRSLCSEQHNLHTPANKRNRWSSNIPNKTTTLIVSKIIN